jgi:DnaJ-class molecular chaperone
MWQQGLYAMNQNVRGNLIINVKLVTPILTPNQRKMAQDLLEFMNLNH